MSEEKTQHPLRIGAAIVVLGLLGACASTGAGTGAGPGSSSGKPHNKPAAVGTKMKGHKKKSAAPKNAVATQAPAPVESNPPGDIPDSTAFIPFRSSRGRFELRIPEGWARRQSGSAVTFTSKLNSVSVDWSTPSSAPSLRRAKSHDVRSLQQTVPAFQLVHVQKMSLPGGPAILVRYRANSKPNAVTGKRYRLDVFRYQFYRRGHEADLVLSSPVGSDNVDPWRIISESFRWV